jgi:acyl-CoA reductase-like NAD-dependent aldehyde dehydrogenase
MAQSKDTTAERLPIAKTYKLFIGGKFPRSESGRSYKVMSSNGEYIANASQASRKDTREAVQAARGAVAKWSNTTAYNRGQVLYRVAEMLEGRRAQFIAELQLSGLSKAAAEKDVDRAIEAWVYYAGFADKYAQILGSANPVAAPYFNFSMPEPMGVIAIVAPQDRPLSGLVSQVAPAIVSGNACVVVASEQAPLPAISLAEVIATSDVPGGVINVLTGFVAELAPVLAAHMDVNAIDLGGVEPGSEQLRDLEALAAENLKRVLRPKAKQSDSGSLDAIANLVELKTVWHPIGV